MNDNATTFKEISMPDGFVFKVGDYEYKKIQIENGTVDYEANKNEYFHGKDPLNSATKELRNRRVKTSEESIRDDKERLESLAEKRILLEKQNERSYPKNNPLHYKFEHDKKYPSWLRNLISNIPIIGKFYNKWVLDKQRKEVVEKIKEFSDNGTLFSIGGYKVGDDNDNNC